MIDEFTALAIELLSAADEQMGELVRSGYGVEPADFYGEAMRLMQLRLRSIGFTEDSVTGEVSAG